MKHTRYYILLLLCLLSSCSSSYLDMAPDSVMNTELFYKNAKDFEQAVIGAYDALQAGGQYGGDFRTLMELRSDNATAGGNSSAARINAFMEVSGDDVLQNAWGDIYKGITRCNAVLERIGPVAMDEQRKLRYQAEARFIRGLSYFNLVRLWGPVPIITTVPSPEEALGYRREPVEAVYTFIENDLTFAAQHLPLQYDATNVGRATATAAQALLGKVLLTQRRYADAAAALQPVLGKHSLLPDVKEVFSVDNEMNAEIIFAVRWLKGNEGTGLFYSVNETSSLLEPSLLAAYTAGDLRKPLLALKTVSGTIKVPAKFYDTFSANNNVGTDFPVLRYADVLLMYAEARNGEGYAPTGEALDALNAVRARAGVALYDATDLPNQEAFQQAVWKERRLELALECDRWFDLVRTGATIDAMKTVGITIAAHQSLYLVPQREIDLMSNPAKFAQNPGY